jgi:para-nitrobenzyl esterase
MRRTSLLRLLVLLALAACCSCSAGPSGSSGSSADGGGDAASIQTGLTITTDKGNVHGKTAGGVRAFLGIPFAGSTAGSARWKAPQPVAPWTGNRDATALGPICPQINPSTMAYDTTGSEDCLSLNVWTPDPAPARPLPVMVWIFGGAFKFGSGGAAPYGGSALVPKGVVVVTLNYRIGALGFLAHQGLAAEATDGSTGNYGLLDQRAALEWVQSNITAFGGDKDNVTLFGESAGGNSVCLHLLSKGSRGLFHKAIIESGLCMKTASTLAAAEATGDRFATAMGCTDASTTLSCLRALTPQAVTNGPTNTPAMLPGGLFYQDSGSEFFFQPVVDGPVLSDQPETLFAAKQIAPVPVLQGANTGEGVLFHSGVFGDTPLASVADYQAALMRRFGSSASTVAAQYPPAGYPTPNDALTQVTADAFFVCPARKTARLLEAAGNKTYLYSFGGTLDNTPLAPLAGKAFHSAELPYVFGQNYLLGSVPAANAPLADAIEGYWTRFAATGDPNGGSAVAWPAYSSSSDQDMTLDTTIAVASGLEKAACDFWDMTPVLAP